MKELAALSRVTKYAKSATGKRAQIRNEIRPSEEIVTELEGWSVRAIGKFNLETKEITGKLQNLWQHTRHWQVKAPASDAVTPKRKEFQLVATPNKGGFN